MNEANGCDFPSAAEIPIPAREFVFDTAGDRGKMLNQMRRGASGWVAKVFLGALAVSFVGWGIADVLRSPGTGHSVLTAGDTSVTVREYQEAYQQGLNRLAQQLQRRPNAEEAEMRGVDQSVLAQLTAGALLDEKARQVGLGVSDDGLVSLIQQEQAFRDGSGNFSRTAMASVLRNVGMTEAMYLDDLRRSASRNQLVASLSDGAAAPAAFAEALGTYTGERRTVNYVTLQPTPADEIADPAVDELDDFFTEHHDDYRAPEYRGFSYVLLSPAAVADATAVTDEQVSAYYETNKARFTTPERRQIEQVVFPNREAADKAAAAIAGGATLADAAAAAGLPVADLGLVPRTAIPNAVLADAAFSAAPNVPTAVVDGPFGPVILLAKTVTAEVVKPLDEAREEIRATVALDAANAKVTAAYTTINEALTSGAALSEAATQAGLTVQVVEPIDRSAQTQAGVKIADIPSEATVLPAVFSADPGAETTPVNFDGNSYVFFALGDIVPARDRKMDEVTERVTADWKRDEAQRLVEERAQALAERVRKGETFAAMAEVEGLIVQSANFVTRDSGPAVLGQAGTRAAFSGSQGTTAHGPALASGEAIVLQVAEVAEPADPLSNVAPNLRQSLDDTVREDLFQSYVAALQAATPVSYNFAAINQAKVGVR